MAQLAARKIVALEAVGSNPTTHPIEIAPLPTKIEHRGVAKR